MAGSLSLPWSRALVVGLGASGLSAARLLLAAGVATTGYDQRTEIAGLPSDLNPALGSPSIPDAAFAGIDLLVLSPGVPPAPILARQRALAPGADVHGELSLALFVSRRDWPETPTVLVTGTNGKSTVTALLDVLLTEGGMQPFAGGNLGPPVSELVREVAETSRPRPGALVLECSSYQLETLHEHPTDVAMVLNVAPDHLSRYESMRAYADTKAKIFSGLGAHGLALIAADDPECARIVPRGPWTVVEVGGSQPPRVEPDFVRLRHDECYARSSLALAGEHNAGNAAFALLAARHLGVTADACRAALPRFHGLPHRMQRVANVGGVVYFNDSKATNVSAVVHGLAGFPHDFVLILGGQAKGEDLSPLRPLIAAHARALVTIGEAAAAFESLGPAGMPVVRAASMDEAVAAATELASPGDAVVLSPACASWDMFRSFAHRGDAFMEAVKRLDPDRA